MTGENTGSAIETINAYASLIRLIGWGILFFALIKRSDLQVFRSSLIYIVLATIPINFLNELFRADYPMVPFIKAYIETIIFLTIYGLLLGIGLGMASRRQIFRTVLASFAAALLGALIVALALKPVRPIVPFFVDTIIFIYMYVAVKKFLSKLAEKDFPGESSSIIESRFYFRLWLICIAITGLAAFEFFVFHLLISIYSQDIFFEQLHRALETIFFCAQGIVVAIIGYRHLTYRSAVFSFYTKARIHQEFHVSQPTIERLCSENEISSVPWVVNGKTENVFFEHAYLELKSLLQGHKEVIDDDGQITLVKTDVVDYVPSMKGGKRTTEALRKRVVHDIKEILENEKLYCDEDLNLGRLAAIVGVRPDQLSEVLNQSLNTTFSDYMNLFRVNEAKRMLKDNPDQSILSIALACGFGSKSNFNRVFKVIARQTPTAFRRQLSSRVNV